MAVCLTCKDGSTCDTCPDGYFLNTNTKICEICSDNCLTCEKGTANNLCITCKNS